MGDTTPRRPTLKDVARLAEVSLYSASRALAGKPGVGERTRTRVLGSAEELGYVSNALGVSLQSGASSQVAMLTVNDRIPFYSTLLRSLRRTLLPAGYTLSVSDAAPDGGYDVALERAAVEDVVRRRVDAAIATYAVAESTRTLLERAGIPLIYVDSPPPSGDFWHVGTDNELASERVADHLAGHGRRQALYLAFPGGLWTTRGPREAGFVRRAEALGMDVEILECDNDAARARQQIASWFERLPRERWPDAIYATNTAMLQALLRVIPQLGIRVPDEVSVIAFDDFEWAEFIVPALTLVDQHIDVIGERAAAAALACLDGKSTKAQALLVEPTLTVRRSCGCNGAA